MSATAIIVGAGPAGLMAAERLAEAGLGVDLYDAMPSVGRKLLMAGRGGLNLTHTENVETFVGRYGAAAPVLAPLIDAFDPAALRRWAETLGIATFVGTSGRVFPVALKASPLLRAWLGRLRDLGVKIHPRHRWTGFDEAGGLRFDTPARPIVRKADVTILALGGASWPRLGSDGAWAPILVEAGVGVTPLRPANCGLLVPWSAPFIERWAGTPLKTITLGHGGRVVAGEAVITRYGIEGGVVYALGPEARDAAEGGSGTVITLDLKPGWSELRLAERLARPRRGASFANFLRKSTGLPPIAASLLREFGAESPPENAVALARLLKSLPIPIIGTAPLERAISTAGGIRLDELDAGLMLRHLPGLFVAGEMLDWEAPTGGYLLQACFATGYAAAEGALCWLG
jgi:uncharacterized flavoprotein (TIGR03862 family)